jgi:hypothetical protein
MVHLSTFRPKAAFVKQFSIGIPKIAFVVAFAFMQPWADLPAMIGSGGFSPWIGYNSDTTILKRDCKILADVIGVGMIRVTPRAYEVHRLSDNTFHPEILDVVMNIAFTAGLSAPVCLVEYYFNNDPNWDGGAWRVPIDQYNWYEIGRALAQRFAPGSTWNVSKGHGATWGMVYYQTMNEPGNEGFNPAPGLDMTKYHDAQKAFADGIHSVSAALKVSNGGFLHGDDGHGKALVDLYNNGTLSGMDEHDYVDNGSMNYGAGAGTGSAQSLLDDWMRPQCGITAQDMEFYSSEANFDNWRGLSDDAVARCYMTHIWGTLGVVGPRGQPITRYYLAWQPLDTEPRNGLCSQISPWLANSRGRIFQMNARLTKGMDIISSTPKTTGEVILTGANKKMWVWHNRAGWSNKTGTSYTVAAIPSGSTKIDIFRYNSWSQTAGSTGTPAPYRTMTLSGETSLTIDNLPTEETFMFLATGGTVARTAFNGPHKIPGRTEAEDYDNGGEGVAYHDSDAVNNGGQYRQDGVDIEVAADPQGGGYSIGWGNAGEWLEYTIDSVKADKYDVNIRCGTGVDGAQVRVKLDGVTLGTVSVPNLGTWTDMRILTIAGVTLAAGTKKILRIEISGTGEANINWIEFVKAQVTGAGFTGRHVSVRKPEMMEFLSLDGRVVVRQAAVDGRLTGAQASQLRNGIYIIRQSKSVPSGRMIVVNR